MCLICGCRSMGILIAGVASGVCLGAFVVLRRQRSIIFERIRRSLFRGMVCMCSRVGCRLCVCVCVCLGGRLVILCCCVVNVYLGVLVCSCSFLSIVLRRSYLEFVVSACLGSMCFALAFAFPFFKFLRRSVVELTCSDLCAGGGGLFFLCVFSVTGWSVRILFVIVAC